MGHIMIRVGGSHVYRCPRHDCDFTITTAEWDRTDDYLAVEHAAWHDETPSVFREWLGHSAIGAALLGTVFFVVIVTADQIAQVIA